MRIIVTTVLLLLVSAEKTNLDDPVLFCDGCFAMVSEIEKSLSVRSGQTLKARIEKSLASVCTTDKLRSYKFSPPTQVKTCTAILGRWRPLLTSLLRDQYRGGSRPSLETLTDIICTQVET